jgi:hypothetical protein
MRQMKRKKDNGAEKWRHPIAAGIDSGLFWLRSAGGLRC